MNFLTDDQLETIRQRNQIPGLQVDDVDKLLDHIAWVYEQWTLLGVAVRDHMDECQITHIDTPDYQIYEAMGSGVGVLEQVRPVHSER